MYQEENDADRAIPIILQQAAVHVLQNVVRVLKLVWLAGLDANRFRSLSTAR
jgi:hypothetical protein